MRGGSFFKGEHTRGRANGQAGRGQRTRLGDLGTGERAATVIRDRWCVHYAEGTPAEPYAGEIYLRALQRLKGSEAAMMARRVEQFFWSDAKAVRVWLCEECSERLRLSSELKAGGKGGHEAARPESHTRRHRLRAGRVLTFSHPLMAVFHVRTEEQC